MGDELVRQLLPTLNRMAWPESQEATQLGRKAYEIGLDKADEYQSDPKTLAAALRIFQSGESQPYAFAGVAYTLLKAAREEDGSYSEIGLTSSLAWLEKAQALAPDLLEVNMIEAFIYVYSGRYDDARIILDYLENISSVDYYVLRAEIAYWQEQGKLEGAVHWYQKAVMNAETVPQKLRLRKELGDCYFQFQQYDKAVSVYQEAVHFATENPWLWHQMSLAYWEMGDYEEAAHCNRRALKIQKDMPEALKMQDALKEKIDSGGLTKRLFGR